MRKILAIGFVALSLFLINQRHAFASEGTYELRNRVGEASRCWASSVLLQDQNYRVVVSCRDIVYPGGVEVFSYVVWANPASGGNAFKLGTLDLGKVEFKTKNAFVSLFVTKEGDGKVRSPSGQVVMQGGLQRIDFLERPADSGNSELGEPELSPIPTPSSSGGISLVGLGTAALFFLLVVVIFVVFWITRR